MLGCEKGVGTYGAACSSPLSHWRTEKHGIGHLMTFNVVRLDDAGDMTWNKDPISDAQLRALMQQAGELNPLPQVVLEVASKSPCDRVQRVREIMNAAPICQGEKPLCAEGQNPENWPETGGP